MLYVHGLVLIEAIIWYKAISNVILDKCGAEMVKVVR